MYKRRELIVIYNKKSSFGFVFGRFCVVFGGVTGVLVVSILSRGCFGREKKQLVNINSIEVK